LGWLQGLNGAFLLEYTLNSVASSPNGKKSGISLKKFPALRDLPSHCGTRTYTNLSSRSPSCPKKCFDLCSETEYFVSEQTE